MGTVLVIVAAWLGLNAIAGLALTVYGLTRRSPSDGALWAEFARRDRESRGPLRPAGR